MITNFIYTIDTPRTCHSDQFKCTHINKCVPTSYLCDGDNDCGDWSDEQNPKCTNQTTTRTAGMKIVYLIPFNFWPPLIFVRGWTKIKGT